MELTCVCADVASEDEPFEECDDQADMDDICLDCSGLVDANETEDLCMFAELSVVSATGTVTMKTAMTMSRMALAKQVGCGKGIVHLTVSSTRAGRQVAGPTSRLLVKSRLVSVSMELARGRRTSSTRRRIVRMRLAWPRRPTYSSRSQLAVYAAWLKSCPRAAGARTR